MGGVYRIQTFFGFLYFFCIYKAAKIERKKDAMHTADTTDGKVTNRSRLSTESEKVHRFPAPPPPRP